MTERRLYMGRGRRVARVGLIALSAWGVMALADTPEVSAQTPAPAKTTATTTKKTVAKKDTKAEKPSGQDKIDDKARKFYLKGREYFDAAKYSESAKAFQEAYRLSKRPLLLLSIASAQERAGQFDEALRTLREYQPFADSKTRSEVEFRISSLESRLASLESGEAEPKAEKESSVLPWVLIGSGVAVAGGGAAFLIMGQADHDDAEAITAELKTERDWTAEVAESWQDKVDSGDTKKLVGGVMAGVGGVALATGVIMLILDGGDEEGDVSKKGEMSVDAFVSPLQGGGFFGLQGRF